MGSVSVAAWIAHVTFWGLLLYGWARHELGPRRSAVFLFLWICGLCGLPYIIPFGAALFSSFVAMLDIALVLLIFKGDVRLT
jgi:hypothetical protein